MTLTRRVSRDMKEKHVLLKQISLSSPHDSTGQVYNTQRRNTWSTGIIREALLLNGNLGFVFHNTLNWSGQNGHEYQRKTQNESAKTQDMQLSGITTGISKEQKD